MKRLTLIFFMVLFSVNYASESSHYKASEKLISLISSDEILNEYCEENFQIQLYENPHWENHLEVVRNFHTKYFNSALLKRDMTYTYMKYFSEDEINYMINFYKSQTGKKLLKLYPNLIENWMSKSFERFEKNRPSLEKMIKEGPVKYNFIDESKVKSI